MSQQGTRLTVTGATSMANSQQLRLGIRQCENAAQSSLVSMQAMYNCDQPGLRAEYELCLARLETALLKMRGGTHLHKHGDEGDQGAAMQSLKTPVGQAAGHHAFTFDDSEEKYTRRVRNDRVRPKHMCTRIVRCSSSG